MDRIQIEVGGKLLTFSVRFEEDFDAGPPWEVSDCHGPVSKWTTRDKRPGELILNRGWRGKRYHRYYDFAEACKIALRDGWDCQSNKPDSAETPRQRAERAARADYEYLRDWCNDEWRYVGVIVTLLDDDGETEVTDSLWAVETYHDFHLETAKQLADELAHGMGTRWEEVTVKTYKPIA